MERVVFIQLPPPRFSFGMPPTNIPLAAGFLLSALKASGMAGIETEVVEAAVSDVFADRGLLLNIAERKPAILAMTLYVWNVERSLFLAANLKRLRPETRILVGGPEVTPDNLWVLQHPAVDAGVFGEGESRIQAVLSALIARRVPEDIPGVCFKGPAGIILNTESADPWDLSSCPYPYLDGNIKPSTDGTLFLETVRGCPFRCRYCYYHKAFRGVRSHPAESVERVLDFAYERDSPVREIYLMDPTFNGRKGFREILRSMAARRSCKDVLLHTELRGDLLTSEDVTLLVRAGLRSAEIGLQSINPAVLRAVGRKGDPDKTLRGAVMLKEAGIDVTTGIIVGLPNDTPESFSQTLTRLNQTQAYSVVHPFVLSVLPGTDFRARSSRLGLTYEPRPPYYVRATPTFSQADIRAGLSECEAVFRMELDYIAPPSLVDRGPDVTASPSEVSYISTWIVGPTPTGTREGLLRAVIERATDPFTVRFRGDWSASAEKELLTVLQEFSRANPHGVLHLATESPEPAPPSFFRKALDVAGNPNLFLNRSYRPLLGDGAVVSVNFFVILPDPGDPRHRRNLARPYRSLATAVWDCRDLRPEGLAESDAPLLISSPMSDVHGSVEEVLNALQKRHGDHPEEVLFRDPVFRQVWDFRTRSLDPALRFRETILASSFAL